MASSNAGGRGRKSTSFMRQLVQARAEPLKRARTESDANAAMLLLSCMRREDSLPALGAPVAA